MTTVLEIQDLTLDYRVGREWAPAVRGVALSISPGETVALVGESGSGKSSTAHAVIGLLPRNARITGGSIRFQGTELSGLSERGYERIRGRGIGFVPQDPGVSLNPVYRIGEQIAETLRVHGIASRAAAHAAAVSLLEEVGVPEAGRRARQYPHELSGGLKQRALIAIAIAARPALIIADEPTSALDVTVQQRILDRLQDLTAQHGTAMLLVTHDLAVAGDRADRTVVMQHGRVVESGETTRVLTDPNEDYTRKLLAAAPSLQHRLRVETVDRPNPFDVSIAPSAGEQPIVLEARDVSKSYRSRGGGPKAVALQPSSIALRRAETLALVGESGSGKTTLARIVSGLLLADSGEVRLDDRALNDYPRSESLELRRRIQYVYQNPFRSLDPRYTVERTILEPLRSFSRVSRASLRERAVQLLEQVALTSEFLDRLPPQLSGGQRQRVAIARAIAAEPDVLVLDEPVSALDVSVQSQILDLLRDLQRQQGPAYLFVSHDLAVVSSISHRVAVMQSGTVLESGTTEQVFSAPAHPYTRALLRAIPGSHLKPFDHSPTPIERETIPHVHI